MENLKDEIDLDFDDPVDGTDQIIDEDDDLLDHQDPETEMIEAILEYGGPEALADGELHRPLSELE